MSYVRALASFPRRPRKRLDSPVLNYFRVSYRVDTGAFRTTLSRAHPDGQSSTRAVPARRFKTKPKLPALVGLGSPHRRT